MASKGSNRVLRFVVKNSLFVLFLVAAITAFNFPYDVGPPSLDDALSESAQYYQDIYRPTSDGKNHRYITMGQDVAHSVGVSEDVAGFVKRYRLAGARTLEVGAGSGTLQDLTEDYTGLDIAASAERFFHKPFVQGSATDLPFDSGSFEVVWTVWTLEHVPDPELALLEMRRVLRDGGYLYLRPVWNNPTWASQPFLSAPLDQMRLRDKAKLMILLLDNNPVYRGAHRRATRLLRLLASRLAPPTRLRYREMTPNYGDYALPDADAVNSIDCYEARLWFESRGDLVLEANSALGDLGSDCSEPVLVQVRK